MTTATIPDDQTTNGRAPALEARADVPDFVVDLLRSEIVRRWLHHLGQLSDADLKALIESLDPTDGARESGGPDGGTPPSSSGESWWPVIVIDGSFGGASVTVPPTTVRVEVKPRGGGGKAPKEPVPNFLPSDAGTQ